jgi:hypothetical protein
VRVSGLVLRTRHLYLLDAGKDAQARVLAALPADLRDAACSGFIETHWYPYEFFTVLNETIDRVLGCGDLALCEQMGRFNCDHNLNRAMRLLFKFGNIGWLLDRAAKVWGAQFDEARMEVVERDVGSHVVVELHGHPQPNRGHCLAIRGWAIRAVEISGEDHVECTELCRAAGDEVCRWTFRWTPRT